jgi:urea transport system ATP-binding protein
MNEITGNNILEVNDVSVAFDGFTVLDGMNFSMEYGELRFLIGPNGAGKTTLLDIITGKTKPHSGHVMFDGFRQLEKATEHKIVRSGIGRKFQTPSIFSSLTVYENLETAVSFDERSVKLIGGIKAEKTEKIEDALEKISLADRADERAGLLSHGQKQWLEIGMLLVQEPKLLLLDEPVAGMTKRERDRTGELVQEIAKERSVLVVEHDMEFVRGYASIVTVLHMGSVLCEGPMEEVQENPEVIEVYLGRGRGDERVTRLTRAGSRAAQAEVEA